MRHLTMLTLMTVAVLTSGCNRGWPRCLCRGDDCGTTTSNYGGCESGATMSSPTYGPAYGPGYLPYATPSTELPGPVLPQG